MVGIPRARGENALLPGRCTSIMPDFKPNDGGNDKPGRPAIRFVGLKVKDDDTDDEETDGFELLLPEVPMILSIEKPCFDEDVDAGVVEGNFSTFSSLSSFCN